MSGRGATGLLYTAGVCPKHGRKSDRNPPCGSVQMDSWGWLSQLQRGRRLSDLQDAYRFSTSLTFLNISLNFFISRRGVRGEIDRQIDGLISLLLHACMSK